MKSFLILTIVNILLLTNNSFASDSSAFREYKKIDLEESEIKDNLNKRELGNVFNLVFNHPVTSLDALPKYDPTGIIGFCFGRSMAVNLVARQMGLKKKSIKKVFIVGDLRSGEDPEWRFHVTTALKGPENQYYAIDPIMNGFMPLESWISRVKNVWDKKRKAYIYITERDAIMPDLSIFRGPDEEKGDILIELAFDPNTKKGFNRKNYKGHLIYSLGQTAQQKYFSSVYGKSRFNFVDIRINKDVISYEDYFIDLLKYKSIDELIEDISPKTERVSRTSSTVNRVYSTQRLRRKKVRGGFNFNKL